jgi:purine-binding chemotaxis protein CheW
MDIAEIRKRTKGKAAPSDTRPPAPDEPLSAAPAAAAAAGSPSPGADASWMPASAAGPADSGLDRLFSAVQVSGFAGEDNYQSSLVAQDARDDDGLLQCLSFQLGTEEYALDITRISEIIKPRDYTDIPRVPEFIVGLISLRGVVVPIIDLRRRFNLGSGVASHDSRIIVCRAEEVTAGLLVDSITQVLRLSADQIEPPPAILSGIDRQLVSGVGRYQGRMVIMLNLSTVLDLGVES